MQKITFDNYYSWLEYALYPFPEKDPLLREIGDVKAQFSVSPHCNICHSC